MRHKRYRDALNVERASKLIRLAQLYEVELPADLKVPDWNEIKESERQIPHSDSGNKLTDVDSNGQVRANNHVSEVLQGNSESAVEFNKLWAGQKHGNNSQVSKPNDKLVQINRRQTQQTKMPNVLKIESEQADQELSIDDNFMEFENKKEIKQPELKVLSKLKMKTQVEMLEETESSVRSSSNLQATTTEINALTTSQSSAGVKSISIKSVSSSDTAFMQGPRHDNRIIDDNLSSVQEEQNKKSQR